MNFWLKQKARLNGGEYIFSHGHRNQIQLLIVNPGITDSLSYYPSS